MDSNLEEVIEPIHAQKTVLENLTFLDYIQLYSIKRVAVMYNPYRNKTAEILD